MALPLTEGLFGLEKFTFLSEQGQQAIPNVAYGLGLDNHVNFNDRYHGQPNPISGSMGLGRSHPSHQYSTTKPNHPSKILLLPSTTI